MEDGGGWRDTCATAAVYLLPAFQIRWTSSTEAVRHQFVTVAHCILSHATAAFCYSRGGCGPCLLQPPGCVWPYFCLLLPTPPGSAWPYYVNRLNSAVQTEVKTHQAGAGVYYYATVTATATIVLSRCRCVLLCYCHCIVLCR